jgi:DNA-binding MarR family transcriptional regulator
MQERILNKINICRSMLTMTLDRLADRQYAEIWPQLENDRQILTRLINELQDEIQD